MFHCVIEKSFFFSCRFRSVLVVLQEVFHPSGINPVIAAVLQARGAPTP